MWTRATVASPPRSRGDVMFILTYKRAFLWQFIAVIVMDLLSLMSQKLHQWTAVVWPGTPHHRQLAYEDIHRKFIKYVAQIQSIIMNNSMATMRGDSLHPRVEN